MTAEEDEGRCVLVDATPADTELLRALPRLETVPAAELAEWLAGAEGHADLVVVGSGCAAPLPLVQRAQRMVPDAGVAVLAADPDQVRRQASYAPAVPLDLVVAGPGDGDLLDRLRALREAAIGRRRHSAIMAAVARSAADVAGPAHAGVAAVGALLEHAPIAVLVVDPSGELLGWNRRAEVMLGLQPASNGQPVDAVLPGGLSMVAPAGPHGEPGGGRDASTTPSYVAIAGRTIELSAIRTQTDEGRPVVLLLAVDVTAQRQAERERERLAGHVQLLGRISESLMASLDVSESLSRLAGALVPALADWVSIRVRERHDQPGAVVTQHRDSALAAQTRQLDQLTRRGFLTDVGRAAAGGRSALLAQLGARELAEQVPDPRLRSLVQRLGMGSAIAVPLPGRDGVLGSLLLVNTPGGRSFDETELAVAVEIGRRAGITLDRARLGTAQALLAEELQRSLLTDPPEPDQAQIVVRYMPAAEAARVGGDWYDAFIQASGATMLVIGDVAGHDTAAAAAMGQLRGLLRGIATYSDAGPAEVLRGLDASMELLQLGTIATAAVVRFERSLEQRQEGTRMLWASAGHPPPLILHRDGAVEVPGDWHGELLLGVDPAARRHEHVVGLGAGATVLLYTDGLVERRDAPLDEGLERLVRTVADLGDADLDDLCDGVLDRMVHGRPDDDVALVAVRLRHQDRPGPADAGPSDAGR